MYDSRHEWASLARLAGGGAARQFFCGGGGCGQQAFIPMMGHRIVYSVQATINRKDFGFTFNMMLDGKWIVRDEVQIFIEGELVEQK